MNIFNAHEYLSLLAYEVLLVLSLVRLKQYSAFKRSFYYLCVCLLLKKSYNNFSEVDTNISSGIQISEENKWHWMSYTYLLILT